MKISFSEFLNLVIKTNHLNCSTKLKSYKILYFKSGSGQIMICSSVYKFSAGMYAVVPPYEIYQDIVTSETEELICELTVEPEVKELPVGVYCDSDNSILKQFEKILHEYRGRENYQKEFLDLLSAELYYLILRSYKKSNKNTTSIQDIVQYMDQYFYEDIKVENLAKKAGYTCRHFRNLFIEKTGLPPSEYLLTKRLECSKRLLSTTSLSIIEISQSCGFSSASQFAMLFRRCNRMAPSEFRNHMAACGSISANPCQKSPHIV